ncbi:hypothetical protein SPHS6_03392 [Sphingobium sp. S6]|nr:hypothetical protein SPHS6_03392 [Sphingobium sp. S6]
MLSPMHGDGVGPDEKEWNGGALKDARGQHRLIG